MPLEPHEELALSEALRRVGWMVGYECLGGIPEEAILAFVEVGLPFEDAPRLLSLYGIVPAARDFYAGLVPGARDGGYLDWYSELCERDYTEDYAVYVEWLVSHASA